MVVGLSRVYGTRRGAPFLRTVDTRIFQLNCFSQCMSHPTCRGYCCAFGVDVDNFVLGNIRREAAGLSAFGAGDPGGWFPGEAKADDDYPDGGFIRPSLTERGCVFLSPDGMGCRIHSYCLAKGIDYHELKPLICALFPVTFDRGLLHPTPEADDESLYCRGEGQSLYRNAREEIRHYYGDALVAELDRLEAETLGG